MQRFFFEFVFFLKKNKPIKVIDFYLLSKSQSLLFILEHAQNSNKIQFVRLIDTKKRAMSKTSRAMYEHAIETTFYCDQMYQHQPKKHCNAVAFCEGCQKIAIPKQCIRCKLRSRKTVFKLPDSLWECSVCGLRYGSSCAVCISFQRDADPRNETLLVKRFWQEQCTVSKIKEPHSSFCAVCDDQLSANTTTPNAAHNLCVACFKRFENVLANVTFKQVHHYDFVDAIILREYTIKLSMLACSEKYGEKCNAKSATIIVYLILDYDGCIENNHCIPCSDSIRECQKIALHNEKMLQLVQS